MEQLDCASLKIAHVFDLSQFARSGTPSAHGCVVGWPDEDTIAESPAHATGFSTGRRHAGQHDQSKDPGSRAGTKIDRKSAEQRAQ
jgi:hypothetical protein